MRFWTVIFILLSSLKLEAQSGYIITKKDSLLTGFLQYQRVFGNSDIEIVFYKTKRDKNPQRFPLTSIKEYAIKKDTTIILTDFYPFNERDDYVDLIEVKVVARGSLNLYFSTILEDPQRWPVVGPLGQTNTYFSSVITYLIGDSEGRVLAIDRNNFEQDLNRYLDYDELVRKIGVRKFNYNQIPTLVKLYNSLYSETKDY